MAGELEGAKSLGGLLSGLAQNAFHGHAGITEELLRGQFYPDMPAEEFRPFLEKMRALLKSVASADMDLNQLEAFLAAQTKKQGGITSEQAAVMSKFWKSHKTKIRESLMNQSRWDKGLRGLSWRIDGKSQSRHAAQIHTPVAIIELEFGGKWTVIGTGRVSVSTWGFWSHPVCVLGACHVGLFIKRGAKTLVIRKRIPGPLVG